MGHWARNKNQKVIKIDSHRNRLSKRADNGVEIPFTLSVIRRIPDPCVKSCGACTTET